MHSIRNDHQYDEKYDIKIEFWNNNKNSTNRDLQNYIDSCHKESEIRAAYPEQRNANLNNVANITVNSDGITPHKK